MPSAVKNKDERRDERRREKKKDQKEKKKEVLKRKKGRAERRYRCWPTNDRFDTRKRAEGVWR
jgi:hypothetical protein